MSHRVTALLISPQIHLKRIEIARSYHRAANVLWDKANDSGNPFEDCYPVFFAYRHALELYLKMLGNAGEGTQPRKTHEEDGKTSSERNSTSV